MLGLAVHGLKQENQKLKREFKGSLSNMIRLCPRIKLEKRAFQLVVEHFPCWHKALSSTPRRQQEGHKMHIY